MRNFKIGTEREEAAVTARTRLSQAAVVTDTATPDAELAAIRGFGVPAEAVDPGDASP